MKTAITICLVEQAAQGPFVFHQDLHRGLQQASELGFDAVELFLPSARALNPDDLDAKLRRYGLALAAVGTGAGWLIHQFSLIDPNQEKRQQAIQFVQDLIDFGGRWQAPAIIGSMQGKIAPMSERSASLSMLADALGHLSRHAHAQYRTCLLYEPLNRYETNVFNRITDASDWIEKNQLMHVRILADLFHMNIEEVDMADALRSIAKHLGHVHWADSNRSAIGMGHTDIERIRQTLDEIGYQGFLSGEIFPCPNDVEAARQTMESIRNYSIRK